MNAQFGNLFDARSSFEIVLAGRCVQVASIMLRPGEETSHQLNRHPDSEQVLTIIEGELRVWVGEESRPMRVGDTVIIPCDAPHKFANRGQTLTRALTLYAPPAYPADT